MVMEFMEGGELFERIRKRVSFTEKEACDITKQVCFVAIHYLKFYLVCKLYLALKCLMCLSSCFQSSVSY